MTAWAVDQSAIYGLIYLLCNWKVIVVHGSSDIQVLTIGMIFSMFKVPEFILDVGVRCDEILRM